MKIPGVFLLSTLAVVALGSVMIVMLAREPAAPPIRAGQGIPPRGTPTWSVDPRVPGADLPPVGRSTFDFAVSENKQVYILPFPFEALVERLERRAGCHPGSCMKAVLIPLGRSLQRMVAAPEFFKYPRVVGVIDVEPTNIAEPLRKPSMLLKDRLYLGYQEKANLIEVISYNEDAARFEFQVIKDYRAGGAPKLFYANRAVCMACHQNGAPIFSRPPWDETNANPKIAALLKSRHKDFYGIALDRGVDMPTAIDNATDRANLFSTYQLLWREGCASGADPAAIRCRATAFTAALQYRLTGSRVFDTDSAEYQDAFAAVLARNWRNRWPDGLAIPNADIPNRDPLLRSDGGRLRAGDNGLETALAANVFPAALADVAAPFEPLNARPPLEIWSAQQAADIGRVVPGLAEFIAEQDVRSLDAHLLKRGLAGPAPRQALHSRCDITVTQEAKGRRRIDFNCPLPVSEVNEGLGVAGRFHSEPRGAIEGMVDKLQIGKQSELRGLAIADGHIRQQSGQRVATLHLAHKGSGSIRTAQADAIERLELRWDASAAKAGRRPNSDRQQFTATATAIIVKDFAPVREAIAAMVQETMHGRLDVFSDKPFRRAPLMRALFSRLGMPTAAWCCMDDPALPPPSLDNGETTPRLAAPSAVHEALAGYDKSLSTARPFFRYCTTCHQTAERFPPNFMSGPPARVSANLAHCAERLYVRLVMWELGEDKRAKTPMPPALALQQDNIDRDKWPTSAPFAELKKYAANMLRAEKGKVAPLDEMLAGGYEGLRPCLPGG